MTTRPRDATEAAIGGACVPMGSAACSETQIVQWSGALWSRRGCKWQTGSIIATSSKTMLTAIETLLTRAGVLDCMSLLTWDAGGRTNSAAKLANSSVTARWHDQISWCNEGRKAAVQFVDFRRDFGLKNHYFSNRRNPISPVTKTAASVASKSSNLS